MPKITPDEHRRAAKRIRELIAEYRRSEDLVTIGAYKQGTNPELDIAIKLRTEINDFLQQDAASGVPYDTTLERLYELASVAANAGGEA
jgi:flagellum-specific ATP synthase